MNNSNSYNICPRCGTANGLNAKYCYQCGGQLKVPEEPVVCPRCHTVNTGLANFCRNCGQTLKVGEQTKVCPRCGKEVSSKENVCTCGYSFATISHTTPHAKSNANAEVVNVSSSKGTNKNSGRSLALVSILLLFIVFYVAFVPSSYSFANGVETTLRYGIFTKDCGVINDNGVNQYCLEIVYNAYYTVANQGIQGLLSKQLVELVAIAIVSVFVLSVAVHVICAVIRLVVGNQSSKINWFYLFMAIVTLIASLLIGLPRIVDWPLLAVFKSETYLPGYLIWIVPTYYFVFFIVSLFTKKKAK